MAISLEDIKRAAATQRAAGVSDADLATYGRNVGLTDEEIAYALGKTQIAPTKTSDLNKALENAQYISKLAGDLGDTDVTAGEALALSDPNVRRLAELAWQQQNVNKVSDADLAKYGKDVGLNQDLIDYLLGKEMNLDTSGTYDIGGNTLAAFKKAPEVKFIPTTTTVTGGKGNDTITGAKGNDTIPSAYHEGVTGYDFVGENTGLREPYVPFVGQMLGRSSALLARRNAPDYEDMQFGKNYGTETAQTLKDLQTQRQNMMGMGASKTPAYQPFKYSFTPKDAAAGGIMSLIDGYQAGGNVSGGSTGNMQGSQVVPSTFDKPDAFSPTTYSSTYTAPTTTYTGPGATGITTGTFDQAALDRFINPYTSSVTDPQIREAKRQAQLASQAQAAKFTQAGAFGGTRNILAENEIGRNLATQIGDITGRGQKEAYDAALRAFEAEQGRKLQAATATEQARQVAGQQALTGAATAGQLGLEASRLGEQSKQFGATYGLQTAQSEAQYQQLARDLQQRAEEAQARGDQFAANLALQQLQEAQRAAEASRAFEYQQSRDQYLDPFRELGYQSQLLQGLPISAGATGVSPTADALKALLATSGVLFPTGG